MLLKLMVHSVTQACMHGHATPLAASALSAYLVLLCETFQLSSLLLGLGCLLSQLLLMLLLPALQDGDLGALYLQLALQVKVSGTELLQAVLQLGILCSKLLKPAAQLKLPNGCSLNSISLALLGLSDGLYSRRGVWQV